MKYLFALLFISTLFSCQSRKAQKYATLLDSTERKVFHILIDKNVEDKRLEALIAKKPDLALALAKKQANALKEVVATMAKADVDDLQNAKPLKLITTDYYKSILRLKEMDIQEAQLMSISLERDHTKAQKAQEEAFELARRKLKMHRDLGTLDQARQVAMTKFKETNKID
ncbi:hypothetical protein [Pedobacter rhizosphaerae]|uniref:Uncharacterized protein n=1 Tax=Pedobacter rhizosphaerae TaxID=390241 RepID=A0A1H9MTD4_9SPHI|nr:hypothetical protein [Pedobacter rhizosphaerae]SER26942.1 hypothetical protein SAMN04488023_106139 [Pedobacter rhizosphaerae]